ncbi:efflux transporter outer membrane subunit [Paenalcaligenes sp. Me131]|uniref:efflux transporter outer membrane subunit n=1 Tax=Paenalcaligenes sp. Me131 TaxID=3392636 RepID=UPI003D2AEFDA
MKIVILYIVLIGVLTGCANMNGIDQTERAPLLTAAQVGAQKQNIAWPIERWWQRYQDEELTQLIEQALASSPDVRVTQARLAQAMAWVDQREAMQGPELDAQFTAQRKRYAEQYDAGAPLAGHYGSTLLVGTELRYTFDFWGEQRAALQAALGEAAARSAEVQEARLVLSSRLAANWFELGRLLAAKRLMQEALAVRVHTLNLVEKRVRAGLDTETELKQAQGDLPATERNIAKLEAQIRLQRNALTALAGLPVGALGDAAPQSLYAPAQILPAMVPAELLGRRPDVVASRWRVEAAAHDVEVAKAEFYPNISLRAFFGFAKQSTSVGLSDWLHAGSRMYGIEPAFSLPIFDAGRLRARLRTRQAELDEAVELYNHTLLSAVHEVAEQMISLEALVPQREAQTQTLAARQAAYEVATRQYQSGLTDYLNVLSAQDALLYEKQQQLDIAVQAQSLSVALIRALGGGFDGADIETNFVGM